ncbi:MAG: hypothetical protein ACRDWV_10280 [Acidimicrobiales bacterium]
MSVVAMGVATGTVAGLGTWAVQRSAGTLGRLEARAAADPKLARDAAALDRRPASLLIPQLGVLGTTVIATLIVWAIAGGTALILACAGCLVAVALGRQRVKAAGAARAVLAEAAVCTAECMALLLAGGASLAAAAREAAASLPARLQSPTRPWERWIAVGEAAGAGELAALGELCAEAAAGARSLDMLVHWARATCEARLGDSLTRAQGASVALVAPLILVALSWLGILLYGLVSTLHHLG